jgi:HK97 family phage prohead protease
VVAARQSHRQEKTMQIEWLDFGLVEVKLADDGAKTGTFSGYGAIFGNVDSHGDVIQRGAFADSLKEWGARGKLPPMLLQHGGGPFGGGADDMLPVGIWTSMEENSRGLKVDGRLDPIDTDQAKKIYAGLKNGGLDGLSIGFMTREAVMGTKPGEPDRTLTNIDLWEVSIVTFPSNPKSRVSNVKGLTLTQVREIEGRLRDGGLSQRDAVIASSVLKDWFQRDAGAPGNTPRDAAMPGEMDQEMAELLKSFHRLTDATGAAIFE